MRSYSSYAVPSAVVSASTESAAFALFAVAIALTAVGAWVGLVFPAAVQTYGTVALIAEFGLILTASWWSRTSPINILLFCLFPFLSGFTLVPYLAYILSSFENGGTLILSALSATASMALAGAVATRLLGVNMSWFGRAGLFALLGLIVLGLLQLFVPALQTTGFELALSGSGVVLFALFTAYDIQRIQAMGRMGANPFLLGLSLYLDIFNLFLYILRFLSVLSGNRR